MRVRFLSITYIIISASTVHAQLHVASTERIVVTSANELNLADDLSNSGTIDHLTLTGTAAQTLSGTGAVGSLIMNKASGTATIGSGAGNRIDLTGTLTLTSGTLTTNGNLTLKSNASGMSRIASHTTAGNVSGNVTVERYIDVTNRNKQWRMLGFPYSTAVPIASISGFAIDYTAGTRSMMYFNEGGDNGSYGTSTSARNGGYVSFEASSESIPQGRGVMAWIYGTAAGTANGSGNMSGSLTVVSSGTLNEDGNAVSMPISYTPGKCPNCGWNLVSNPYASAIDWNSNAITKTRLISSVYRYDPQNIRWTTHNGSSGTNGADNIIESGGAFFVKVDASNLSPTPAPALIIGQGAKVEAGSAFTHFGRAPFRLDMPSERIPSQTVRLAGVRLIVSGQGNPASDEAYVDLSRSDATPDFDSRYDAETMGRSGGTGIAVKGAKDVHHAMLFDRPISETGVEKRYYPLRITSPAAGQTKLELRTEGDWNPLNSVSLIDSKEGRTILMQGGRLIYLFKMETLKDEGRFLLAINHVAVDKEGGVPGRQLRLLGNPVTAEKIDLLLAHPTAKPKRWELSTMQGAKVAEGRFEPTEGNVQYGLQAPGMRASGVYVLRVEMDNGEVQTVQVMRK